MNGSLVATRSITDEDIDACGRLTSDFGAHHMEGLGGRRMAQGVLTLCAVPLFGAPGVHMREVSLTFLTPVYAGDMVTAKVDVTRSEEPADGEVELHCQVTVVNGSQTPVITGSGVARLSRTQAESEFAAHGAKGE